MQKLLIAIWLGSLVFAVGPAPLLAQIQPPTSSGDGRLTNRPLVTSSVDELASEFDGARESFLYLDGRDAAIRIRRVIAMMQERARDATDAGRQAISNSVAELDSLAKSIEQRRLTSVRPLDEAFGRANLALANNHLLLAIRAQNQVARQRIGEELNAAIGHFQEGSQRLGRNLRQDEQEMIQSTRKLAGSLIHGVEATTNEIDRGIRSLGQRLEQLRVTDTPEGNRSATQQ